ncbi:protein disulfide isomerase-like 1-3 isoform X2 [Silene latifolia]|uniref:protein disulfide isomerase-like 1-3 isoform X2 n=1 Tax=Silene latifolia TaxID=37657 RepID=UPI003D775C92
MAATKSIFLFIFSLFLLRYTFSATASDIETSIDNEHPSFEDYKAWENSHAPLPVIYDEKDVVVLNHANFWELVNKTENVMVEFYAPWCGYCQALTSEYAAAATELKKAGSDVLLAKVDAIDEPQLADEFKVGAFPTIYLFTNGQHTPYDGERTKDAIVFWLKKKIGVAVQNVMSTKEAAKILATEPKIVIALLDDLTGYESEELDAAARIEDEVNFYKTTSSDVAMLFEIDPKAKRPALVLVKKEAEKLSVFDGNFSKSAITEFVSAKKLPLVITFSRETLELIFENPLNKQMLLFTSGKERQKFADSFSETALAFKDKIVFVYVDTKNEDYGMAMVDHFGIVEDAPTVIAYAGHLDGRKFMMDADITLDNIMSFTKSFLADNLQPFYKSGPIPEINDSNVKIVVGKNYDEVVLDESKDVLLQIYAPWCHHCRALEPIYNKLARQMREVDSIVIAKMDGTINEHPKVKAEVFPTILFFPAGNKKYDPIMVDTDRAVVALYNFLKKHASTSFTIQELEDEQTIQEDKDEL